MSPPVPAAATPPSGRARRAGLLGAALGVVAAGAALGLAVERYVVGQSLRRITHLHDAAKPFGTLRGASQMVTMSDGAEINVELDGQPDAPLTIVFSHGYSLNQDSWHFQRAAFADHYRLVFYDQRSHGRSGRAPAASATMPRLAEDLYEVLEATAPTGPVVLVGHSMGGMALLALTCTHPELFGQRVVGVGLLSSSAGRFETVTLGLPPVGARMLHRMAPGVLTLLARQSRLVDFSRRAGSDLAHLITRHYSFASDVSSDIVDFTARMIEATPIDVVADFFPAFGVHDSTAGLCSLRGVEALVLVGEGDLLAPVTHSAAIAAEVPEAEFVIVPRAGHVVILEHPDLVNRHLQELFDRAAQRAGLPAAPPERSENA